jgi:hypothetical protein
MVKALSERPQLKIEIPIAWVSELDRPALAELQFSAQVREMQAARSQRRKSPGAPSPGAPSPGAPSPGAPQPGAPTYEQLDVAAKAELLTELYKKGFGSEPKYPPAVTDIKPKPDLAAAKVEFLSKALHDRIAVTDSDLTALGQQRAMAVQQLLLTDTQLDPARVFLVANDKAKNQDGNVRLELSLK